MQCYTDILPPTGVTHSLALPLTGTSASNLVVARTSVLQIFDVCHGPESRHAKLSLLAEYHLEGTISALGRVKPLVSKTGADALLIAFRHAKLTLVEWNPQQHSLSTISIHYYENLNLSSCPWSPDDSHCLTHLTVDPSSRCAAFNFNSTSLAIIPFHQLTDDLGVDHLDNLELASSNADNQDKQLTINGDSHATPYGPSFVLPVTALEPDLLHPRAIAFLHGYGDPTLGILYTSAAASNNLDPIRKDVVTYAVYTLDLDQKASTTLLAVKKLPNDLHSIIPVPSPIGGALLIGANDVLHVDQSGKVNAVGVNEFAKECSSFPMADQSNLEYRLEGSQAIALRNQAHQVLLVLANGAFAVLSFRIDGRSVSGISVHALDTSTSHELLRNRCSTLTALGQDHIFIGCEESDSILLHTSQNTLHLKRQASRTQPNGHDSIVAANDEDSMEDDEDDLYGDAAIAGPSSLQSSSSTVVLEICDKLSCIGPIHDIAVGRPGRQRQPDEDESNSVSTQNKCDKLDLVLASSSSTSGSLVIASTELKPQIIRTEASLQARVVWTLSNQSILEGPNTRPLDDILIISSGEEDAAPSTAIFTSNAGVFTELDAADFQGGDLAIATGKLATGSHVVVYSKEVRAYNSQFALDQIVPVIDDETDPPATAKVVSASVVDHCILLLKDDATITFLKADRSGDLDEVTLPDQFPSSNVVTACLYDDRLDYFNTARYKTDKDVGRPVLVATMTEEGVFTLHTVFNLSVEVFRANGLSFLPLQLSPDLPIPKHWRNDDEVVEILVCDLGTVDHRQPCLVVRNSIGDLTIYQPYQIPGVMGSYRFTKLSCHNADVRQNDMALKPSPSQLVAMGDLRGLATVCAIGKFPKLIVKTHETMPTVYTLGTGPMLGATSFHDSSCDRGFAFADEQGILHIAELPTEVIYASSGWVFRRIPFNCELTSLVFYPRTQCYVLATCSQTPFHLPRDDEWHPEWDAANEKASARFLPTTTLSTLKLVSSTSHAVISEFHFEDNEQVLDIKCLNLEISEVTHERKDMIVVGTGVTKGENVVTRGNIYIFDVVDVVPQPDIPESDLKLKLVSKEDVRGAVTALDGIGSQGFLLAAQGQKCMVRGLREDNAILPVAFMDMRFHVSVTKSLAGTGLTILGDTFSGLWLAGYSEEPYKLQLLGRDLDNPSVVTAEFLPQDKQLYIISSDGVGQLRVMQYDPESPLSERGTVLLQRSTFNTGAFPTRMMLLPCSSTPSEVQEVAQDSADEDSMELDMAPPSIARYQVLVATQEGGLSLITPLSDQSYRRLNALQNILTTQLEQVCGLNPRAHRAVETDGLGGRGMIDGLVVRRWLEQSSQHKANLADRVGGSTWEIRSDLEAVLGGHLNML